MKPSCILLTAVLIALVGTAQAGIIYDNGMPDYVSGFWSDADFPQYLADDFTLASGSTTITDVHWWGGYGTQNLLPSDNFLISIYEQVAGSPTISALHSIAVGAVNRVDTGFNIVGSSLDVYEYSVGIAPVVLSANTTYYLSITNDTAQSSDDWLWATSALHTGSFAVRANNLDPWTIVPSELAFQLTGPGNPVPEPATMSLLGMGIVGLALRRRERAA